MAEDDARQQAMRQGAGLDQMAIGALEQVMAGKLMPDQLPTELTARMPFDPASMRPSDSTLAAPWYDQVRQSETQVDVPTIEDTISYFKTRGMNTAPELGGERESRPTPEGGLPSTGLGLSSPPALQQAFDQRESKLDSIDRAQELELDRGFAEAKGNAYNTSMGQEQAAKESFPAVLARARQEQQQKDDMTAAQFERMTPLEVSRAGQVSGAQETAQINARTSPSAIQRQADLAKAIAHVQGLERVEHPDPSQMRPSEGETRAGSMASLLVKAYADMKPLVDNGVRLRMGLLQAAGSPALSSVTDFAGFYTDDEKALGASALNAASVITFTLSGQQTRAEELPRYAAIITPFSTDPEEVVTQKRQTFEAFIRAIQMNAGRSGENLGQTLGQMIFAGNLDPSILENLPISGPVRAGLEASGVLLP